jgi:hypothetical protein
MLENNLLHKTSKSGYAVSVLHNKQHSVKIAIDSVRDS